MESISTFDLLCEKVKDYKGYTVIQVSKEEHSKIFHFDDKADFDKNFELKPHSYYPCDALYPINVTAEYGDSIECVVDGEEQYLDFNNLYLFIDGKRQD